MFTQRLNLQGDCARSPRRKNPAIAVAKSANVKSAKINRSARALRARAPRQGAPDVPGAMVELQAIHSSQSPRPASFLSASPISISLQSRLSVLERAGGVAELRRIEAIIADAEQRQRGGVS